MTAAARKSAGRAVLVCGGRDFRDKAAAYSALDELHAAARIETIIHGGANGADYLAGRWAQDRTVACLEFVAAWGVHGRAAGPIRNQRMLDEGRPDLVVAFKGGRGTEDMVRRAQAAGVDVRRVE